MLRKDFDITSKFQVQTVHSLISAIYEMADQKQLNPKQAQDLSKKLVRKLKYGADGYFWIDTRDGTNLVYLGKETEGTNRYNQKDSNGKLFFHEINEIAQEPEGGYTNYWFPRKGESKPSPKRSYSLAFKPYEWVIGTGNYIDDIDTIVASETEKNQIHLQKAIMSLFAIVFGVLIIAILISYWFSKKITYPIIKMAEAVEEIAEGNLQVKVETDLTDEIGKMGRSMMSMIVNLTKIVERIKAGAEDISVASSEVSSSSEMIAQGANEQASSAEEISSSMEEISASISQNNTNAHEATNIAQSASSKATEVSYSFEKMMASLNLITDKISIIHEIAEKTDLLAINASIEAAKAGEHGKGFAVVANEVRQLAIRCSNAADEIDKISVDTVSVSGESAKLLEGLVPEIKKTTSLIQEISAASTEQDTGAHQINQALQQFTTVTQQNSASSEELAASAANLKSLSVELKKTISFLMIEGEENNEIDGLIEMMDKYNSEIEKIKRRIKSKDQGATKTNRKNISSNKKNRNTSSKNESQGKESNSQGLTIDLDDNDEDFEKFEKF